MAPLVGMLASPSPEMQGTAAGALAELSHLSYDIQAAVARTGAIAPLCTLVREGTAEVKEQSAAALWAVTHENNANKATVAKLGGIEPLVTLLVAGGTERSFEQAVGALGSLCFKHVENREVIAKLIFARLNSRAAMVTTPGGATRTLSSISKLCSGSNANQLAMAKAGCVPSIIMWLSGGIDNNNTQPNYDAQREAANALLDLATNNEPLQGLIVRSHGIPPLIDLVNSNSLATQGAAVRTLWHLASSNESGITIVEAGAMQPLCAMLTSDSVDAQELAAIGISRLLKCDPMVSLTVAKVGGIVPLVKLLRDGSPTGQQQAVCALAEVGITPANRPLIAEAGGIPRLAALLTSDVMGTSETAARAMSYMARDDLETPDDGGAKNEEDDGTGEETALQLAGRQRRRELLSVGAVKKLIAMMTSVSLSASVVAKKMWEYVAKVVGVEVISEADEAKRKEGTATQSYIRPDIEKVIGMQEQAAATLSDLAYGDTDMQDAIIAAGGVPTLITLLRTGSKVSQEHAARAIWHLCAAPDNQGLIVDAGAVAELVALSRVGSPAAQELSAAVISDLAKGAILEREQRVKQRGEELSEPSPSMARSEEKKENVVKETSGEEGEMEGLPEGAVEEGDRLSAIAAAGGVIPLVGLVTNGNSMGKERAASALLHLSVDVVNQMQIAKVGGIPPIVQLLDDGTEKAHEHAVAALARLAHDNPDNQTQIAKKLVGLLSNPTEGAQKRSAHVLWQLAETNPGAPNRIVNAGAISPLVALLGTGSLEAKEEAVGALTCLAHNNPSNQLAIARGLVGLLGAGTAEAQEQVTQMLIKFAQHPDNRMAIAESGAVQRLVIQLKGQGETSVKAQELAATALSHLAGDSMANAASVATHGGIKPLVSMLVSESPEAQARAASALAFVTRSSREVQDSVAKEGAIEHLTNLLQTKDPKDPLIGGSLEGRFEAAGAVWSLALDNEDTTPNIAAAGAIQHLVKLLYEENPNAQKNAAGALAALAAVGGRKIQDIITKEGGIKPLVKLLEPIYVVHVYAGNALAELARSYPANQTAIAAAGAITLLVRLLTNPEEAEEAKAASASAALVSFGSARRKPKADCQRGWT